MSEIKTSILLGYECNNNCRFCYCDDKKDRFDSMTTEQVKQELDAGRERGSRWVDFLGGEPTIRKDIVELVSYAEEIGYETISFTTNGKMFYYRDFAEKIIDAGLNSIIFSVHGATPETHNWLVRDKKGFQLMKKGIQNVVDISEDVYLCINTVLTKENLDEVPEIPGVVNSFVEKDIEGIEMIFPHPKGGALRNFEELVPDLDDVDEPVRKAIENAREEGFEHVVGRYVPFCHMEGVEDHVSEAEASERGISEEHVGPEFRNLDVEKGRKEVGKVKTDVCKNCMYDDRCEGVWKEYAERRGTEELRAVGDNDG